jgi:hypothetical protein
MKKYGDGEVDLPVFIDETVAGIEEPGAPVVEHQIVEGVARHMENLPVIETGKSVAVLKNMEGPDMPAGENSLKGYPVCGPDVMSQGTVDFMLNESRYAPVPLVDEGMCSDGNAEKFSHFYGSSGMVGMNMRGDAEPDFCYGPMQFRFAEFLYSLRVTDGAAVQEQYFIGIFCQKDGGDVAVNRVDGEALFFHGFRFQGNVAFALLSSPGLYQTLLTESIAR